MRSLWAWAVRELVPSGTSDTSQAKPLSSLMMLLTTVGCRGVSPGGHREPQGQNPFCAVWVVDTPVFPAHRGLERVKGFQGLVLSAFREFTEGVA